MHFNTATSLVSWYWHSKTSNSRILVPNLLSFFKGKGNWIVIRPILDEIRFPNIATNVAIATSLGEHDISLVNEPDEGQGKSLRINTDHGVLSFGFDDLKFLRVLMKDNGTLEIAEGDIGSAEGDIGSAEATRVAYFIPMG